MTHRHNLGAPAALSALVLLALALRLPNIGQSVWFDEACMSTQRIGSFAQLLTTIHIDIHPPLYLLFAHIWNGVFGDSEISLRIPSLLAGLGSIPLAFLVARRLVGSGAAITTATLMCVSPVHIWYSIEGRLYAPMVFAALLAVTLFQRILDGPTTRRTHLAYGLTIAVMLALHYYLAVYVLLFALLALATPRLKLARSVPRPVLWINGIGLLLIAGWVAMKAALVGFETSQGYMRPFTPTELYRFLFQWCWTGDCLPAGLEGARDNPRWITWAVAQALGAALFVRGLVELWRQRTAKPQGLLLVAYFACLPVFLLALPLLGYPKTYIERSLLPALPFFLMITSLGLVSLRPVPIRRVAVSFLVLISMANLAAYFAYGDRWTVYKPHPDWRGAAGYFDRELDQGAAQRPIYSGMPNSRSLAYYDARIQDAHNLAPSTDAALAGVGAFERLLGKDLGGRAGEFASSIAQDFESGKAQLAAGAELFIHPIGDGTVKGLELSKHRRDGVLYLVDNQWHHSSDGRVERLLQSPRLQLVEQHNFKGIAVYKLREKRRP